MEAGYTSDINIFKFSDIRPEINQHSLVDATEKNYPEIQHESKLEYSNMPYHFQL
jgi:hypothetical protein